MENNQTTNQEFNEEFVVTKNNQTEKIKKRKKFNFTPGNILFLIVLNIIVITTIINLCVRTSFWAHYVAIGSLTAYFVIYAFLTNTAKNINIRLTFAVMFINFFAAFFAIFLLITKYNDHNWIWQYFIPILIMFNNLVTTVLLVFNKITFVNALMTFCMNLFQSLVQMILIIIFVGINSSFVSVFSIVSFSYCLLGVINAIFIKGFQITNNIGKSEKI